MAIRFIHPWFLLLLPLSVYPLWLWYRDNRPMAVFRRRLIASLRFLLLLCLILALAGTQINYRVNRQNVVFVVDLSASCAKEKAKAENFIREALQYKKPQDKAAVVVFGENPRVDQALGGGGFSRLESIVEKDYSNVEEALKLAGALLPEDARRRIVLLSDGRENDGDARRETEMLAQRQVRLDAWPLESEAGPDVRIESLQAPTRMFIGENLSLKLDIYSNYETSALLRIFENQIPLREDTVQLRPGENRFTFPINIDKDGFHTFKAMLEVRNDTVAENNEAAAYTMVKGPARILLAEGTRGESAAIASALRSLNLAFDVILPGELSPGLEELKRYSLLILCNVPAEDLQTGVMESIQAAVRDLGMGLVMVGGENSFGPGGYLNTPVEQALPVHMDLRGKKKIPSLGLMLVIDKSGSMSETSGGVCKVDLAKDAAAQAVSVLGAQDRVGVIAFDDTAQWVVKTQAVRDLDAIQADIGTIRADGGTSIFPALALGYSGIKDVPTKYKHIILLTDGMSANQGDYYFLARRMQNAGITLSTVAVGKDADTQLLKSLAEWGQGRYYYCDDARKVPRIFTKESIKARRDYLVEEEFYPAINESGPLLQGIDALPPLHGYVGTSPKTSGQVVLVSQRGDPVLAQWQYGLGRAVAFTSDAGGRWSESWVRWPGYNRLWSNIISWALPRTDPEGELSPEINITGTKGSITVDSPGYSGMENLQAVIIGPDLTRQEVKLQASAPGIYAAGFKARQPGIYIANVLRHGNEEISAGTAAASIPYSPEYRYSGADKNFLSGLTRAGGGTIIDKPADAFADNLPPAQGGIELWPWLLLAATILLPLDIAARRLPFTWLDVQRAWGKLVRKTPALENETAPTISRLRTRKEAVEQARGEKYQLMVDRKTENTADRDSGVSKKAAGSERPTTLPKEQKKPPAPSKQENISRLLQARKNKKD